MIEQETDAKAEVLWMIGPDSIIVAELKQRGYTEVAQFEDDGRVKIEFKVPENLDPFAVEMAIRLIGERDNLDLRGWWRDGNKLCTAIFRRKP